MENLKKNDFQCYSITFYVSKHEFRLISTTLRLWKKKKKDIQISSLLLP